MDKQLGTTLLNQLDHIQTSVDIMRTAVVEAMQVNPPQILPARPTKLAKRSKIQTAESLPATELGLTPRWQDEAWPQATLPHMIVHSKGEAEKNFRALQVLHLIGVDFTDLAVLDVGCGEGHVTAAIATQTKNVFGYDLHHSPSWDNFTDLRRTQFTTDKATVAANNYNIIVMYDVLDHLEADDPVAFMTWLGSLLLPQGRIFLRTHPWTSKHGGHYYEQGLNKAFVHLALTADELVQAGYIVTPGLRLTRPLAAYEYIIKESGLKIAERKGHTEPIDPFFTGAILDRILNVTWRGAIEPDAALKIMSNQFIDHVLTKA